MSRASPWLLLAIAIAVEVTGATALKASEGFSQPGPTVVVLAAYAVTIYLVSVLVRRLPLGVVYAVWAGAGTALTAVSSAAIYGESLAAVQLLGIAAIIGGIALLHSSAS